MRLVVLSLALVIALGSQAFAGDAVALLPLDADARLELYSQSVASEVARSLAASGIDVVVVGPKMAVPERARMIVDGTITGKDDAVTLTLRLRDARAGTVLGTVPATATSVTQATDDLSKKIVPAVKTQLAALDAQPPQPPPTSLEPSPPRPAPVKAALLPILGEVEGQGPLRDALRHELAPWARRQVDVMPDVLVDMVVPSLPATRGRRLAIAIEVLGFTIGGGAVPLARARVRVRVVDTSRVVFDRVIRTDTVVGDRGQSSDALAARTAREVLAILDPHLRRKLVGWR